MKRMAVFSKWGAHIIIIYIALFFEITQSAVCRNWEGGKIEGLVTLVQLNMKLTKLYDCWKIWSVYRTIIFDYMHYLQPNKNKTQYSKNNIY